MKSNLSSSKKLAGKVALVTGTVLNVDGGFNA